MGNADYLEEISGGFAAMDIKERVDALMDTMRKWNSLRRLGDGIVFEDIFRVPMESGIEQVADALGEELQEFESSSGRLLYHFSHDGIEFSQLSDRRLGSLPEGSGHLGDEGQRT